jgi:hypothetical protein
MLSVTLAGVMTLMIKNRDTDMFFFVITCFLLFFMVFYGFYIKISSVVFVHSCARKYMRTGSTILLMLGYLDT